jgi:RNA polymerase sigma-70 factor (ECF subfamily)
MSMRPLRDPKQAAGASLALTDEEVVARVLEGETPLFEVLMRRHNQRIFRTARAIVRDEAEAEDVMQEAYVRAYTQLAQFEGRATWATWLTRIAVNEALARVRRRGRFVDADVDGMEDGRMESNDGDGQRRGARLGGRLGESVSDRTRVPEVGPEDQASARELVSFLERAVDALPDIYRTVFVLREVEGLSTADTAGSLDISEDLVKVRLHRARAELRRTLESSIGTAQRDVFGFHLSRCDRVVNAVLARIGAAKP